MQLNFPYSTNSSSSYPTTSPPAVVDAQPTISDKKELVQLQKLGFLPRDAMLQSPTSIMEQRVRKAHQAYQFLEACRNTKHWIHQLLPAEAKKYKGKSLDTLSRDLQELAHLAPLLDNWDRLSRLQQTSLESFQLFVKEASSSGVMDLQLLTEFIQAHHSIYGDNSDLYYRAILAVQLNRATREASHFLPEAHRRMSAPISRDAAKQWLEKLTTLNRSVEAIAHKHGFAGDQQQAFYTYLQQHDIRDASPEQLDRLAHAFSTSSGFGAQLEGWVNTLEPDSRETEAREFARLFLTALGADYLPEQPSHDVYSGLLELYVYAGSLRSMNRYPDATLCQGVRHYLDERQHDSSIIPFTGIDRALYNSAGLPSSVSVGWFSSGTANEKALFAQILKAHLERSIEEYRTQANLPYTPRDAALVTLLATHFTNAGHLPKNSAFTLEYIAKLARAAANTLSSSSLTPAQVVGAYAQASRQHPHLVSFDIQAIDRNLSTRPNEIDKALPLALEGIGDVASGRSGITYGDVFRNARNHVGPATASFLRAIIQERLPTRTKDEEQKLSKALDAISDALATSRYRNIDVILDQQHPKSSAEACRRLLDIVQFFLDQSLIDQQFNPKVKGQIQELIRQQITQELASLQALPPNANILSLLELKNAPITAFVIQELYDQVLIARAWKRAVDEGHETLPLPERAPAFAMTALEILPDLRELLANEGSLKRKQWWATTKVGKVVLPRIAGTYLRATKGKTMSATQRDTIVAGIPAALRILENIDLNNPENVASIRRYVHLLDILLEAVNNPNEPNVKDFSIAMMMSLLELSEDLANRGDLAITGFKGMALGGVK